MKYWVYINNEIKGPFEKEELVKLEGFNKDTLICPQSPVDEETKEWKEAFQFPEVFQMLEVKKEKELKEDVEDKEKTGSPEIPQVSVLGPNDKDVIIERFDSDKVFNLNMEMSQGDFGSVDPLTLSQIRRKQEDLKEVSSENISTQQVGEKIEEYLGKIEEFSAKPKEFVSTDIQIESEQLHQEKEKKPVSAEVKSDKDFLSPDLSFNKESLMKEIINEVENKLSSFVTKNDLDLFKNEIKNYIESKFEAINKTEGDTLNPLQSESTDLIKHLEIDVRDLKIKLESLEKKFDASKNLPVREGAKTVVIEKKEDKKDEGGSFSKRSILKIVSSVFLVILAVGSILFALKQFGIFDITQFFEKKASVASAGDDIFSTSAETSSFNQPTSTTQVFSVSLSSQEISESESSIVSSTSLTDTKSQEEPSQQSSTPQKKEEIIEIVKNYKIANELTLQETIKRVIKSRKIRVKDSDIVWSVKEDGELYKVTIIVNAEPKNIVFRFDFDERKMFLKPLNTLSKNTLRMMMEKRPSKVSSKKAQATTSNNEKLKIVSTQEKETKSEVAETKDLKSSSNSLEDSEEEDYLIIGE